ncbi:hypothetical protein K469DRAFT_713149 [Zopfia rhizophila CBS 207.26]|uniref:Uncharacterized protein n=1 Tax=Zopfia rhizophila CBS 207.26 TaxID=1314779 RepID=A0A6A6DVQ7_9PEZI|nr:hypothetical protein K469DRAFT_713149 [Zopfia rhizophila CBS 207.26]
MLLVRLPCGDLDDVRRVLEENLGSKWGWVVYRITYGDDAEWERFMNHLNTRVRLELEAEGNGDLFSRIDWAVQDDLKLEDASIRKVREHLRRWVEQDGGENDLGTARFHACVVVGQDELESVLEDGPPAEEVDVDGMGWVTVVSLNEEEGDTAVGLSYLTRAYALSECPGWHTIAVGDGDVYCR